MATSQGSNSADLKVILELADKTQGQLEKKKALSANDRTTLKNSRSILNQFIDKDILKLSTNEFRTLQKNLKILNDIIIKAAKSLGSTSPELARLQKTLETKRGSLASEKNKIKTSSTNVTLKSILDGSFNSKEVAFTAKYLEEKLRQAGLKRTNGQTIKGLETYQKIMMSEGAAGFSNSKAAQDFYDKYGLTGETGIAVEKMRVAVRETANNIITLIKEVKTAEREVSAAAKGENPVLDQGYKIQNLSDEYVSQGEIKQDEITKTSNKMATLNSHIQKTQSYLAKAAKQFTVYALVIRSVRRALNEAITTITDLDKSLTEQAMVTGMSRDQAYELVGAYQELALEVGATTKEIAEVATEYMKQGQTIQDSLILTKAAVAAAKVARVDVGDSVNYLTTALNGFQLSAEQAMEVSDKFAAVAAASASDYDELAIALSKVASQANLAGMSMDYTIALLTKGLETTRKILRHNKVIYYENPFNLGKRFISFYFNFNLTPSQV